MSTGADQPLLVIAVSSEDFVASRTAGSSSPSSTIKTDKEEGVVTSPDTLTFNISSTTRPFTMETFPQKVLYMGDHVEEDVTNSHKIGWKGKQSGYEQALTVTL